MTSRFPESRTRRALALAVVLITAACARESVGPHGHEPEEPEAARGPHGGRLLEDGDFTLELAIFERGVPPEFRAWVYERGTPVAPAGTELEVQLARFGGRVDTIRFAPAADFLRGDATVEEPHSFDASVRARRGGQEHRFAYQSREGRVTVDPVAARESGIAVEVAGPAVIRETLALHGRIEPDGDRTAHVTPRFPGVVIEARKRLGDAVAKDEVVAVVESNESLRPYEVRSRIAGVAIEKNAVPGEFVASDAPLYVVSDLGRVWVDLQVHRLDFERLRVGQRVHVGMGGDGEGAEARIEYLSPLGSPDSQTSLARAVLANPDGRWRPGLFVTAHVEVAEAEAPVAVRATALQRLRDWDVVFLAEGDTYEAQPVEIGRSDGVWTEIRSGLAAGQRYAATGSFVLKADVGKSGASHDH